MLRNAADTDMPMTYNQATSTSISPNAEKKEHQEQDYVDDAMLFNVWQRDPEKERDKILGFFVLAGQPIPRDIFHLIMSFVPAFPYYFMLRSVCSQWFYEFPEQIYGNVTHLSLVDDGRPKYYFRKDDHGHDQLVQFKPIDATGKGFPLSELGIRTRNYNRIPIFEFLANVFPNVKHLRLGLGSFIVRQNFIVCVETLLPKFTQLETLDVLGTRQAYLKSHSWAGQETPINEFELGALACSLPSSTKNLNFIGVVFNYNRTLEMLQIFSEKGRATVDMSRYLFALHKTVPITVDIQCLTLPYVLFSQPYPHYQSNVDWVDIKAVYTHFKVSMVESKNNPITLRAPVVSYVDYLNNMSKKEGVFLSHMGSSMRTDTSSIIDATIEIVVQEHPCFQPLLDLGLVLLEPRTKLDANFIFNDMGTSLRALAALTNPDRMKYPELVLNIDSLHEVGRSSRRTILGILVTRCISEEVLTLIKTVIENYHPSMVVNGVRNYLAETFVNSCSPVRTKLMKYLLSIEPELIALGDSEGLINDQQKDLPLIQLFLSEPYSKGSLEDIIYLVTAGASLTQVDKDGNNVLHYAFRWNTNLVQFLLSVCPESLISEGNNKGQTPIEQIFPLNRPHEFVYHIDTNAQIQFLEDISNLSCFKSKPLHSLRTSCGNLLHASMEAPNLQLIQWLLKNGFDANSLNERGESPLFYSYRIRRSVVSNRSTSFHFLINHNEYVDKGAAELIRAGAKMDLTNNEGETIITSALRNKNYELINYIIQDPSISSQPLSKLLGSRLQLGFNALHFIVRMMADITESMTDTNKKQKLLHVGEYPVARHCALLCLEHYPEMLYERSELSEEADLKSISGVSPLQILLEASKGLYLLNDLSIQLSDIANKPVFASKNSEKSAPIPVMYLALEVAIDVPMFDKLMNHTTDILVRDETQDTKPNLLHIAAERDSSLCLCIIKHWKKKYKNKAELSKLINEPLPSIDGRKPKNAALIACSSSQYEVFSILWPYMNSYAAQFDSPVQIALQKKEHLFALEAVMNHGVVPSKAQLHQIIRKGLIQNHITVVQESQIVSLVIQTEEEQSKPSWLELLMQTPSEAADSEEGDDIKSLSTLQLVVSRGSSFLFSWLVRHNSDDPLLNRALKAVDTKTGNTLLHMLTSGSRYVAKVDLSSILLSIVDQFKEGSVPKQPKQTQNKLPSLDHLNTKDLTEFVNTKNKVGRTCLHYAAVQPQGILYDLLVFGASPETKDSEGKTPLELMSDSATYVVEKFLNLRDGKRPDKRKEITKNEDEESDEDDGSRRRKRRRTTKK